MVAMLVIVAVTMLVIVAVAVLVIVAVAVLERLGDRSLRVDEAEAVLHGVAVADLVLDRAGEPGSVGEHCVEGRAAAGDRAFWQQNALTEQIGPITSGRAIHGPEGVGLVPVDAESEELAGGHRTRRDGHGDRKSTRLNSSHTV